MKKKNLVGNFFLGLLAVSAAFSGRPLLAQSSDTLQQRIKKIMDRPEFAHSRFGLEFVTADTGEVIYKLNAS